MRVSVVVPTYSMERYDDFRECIDAVLGQTYEDVEVVAVVDGNDELLERVQDDYGGMDEVVIYGSAPDAGPMSRGNMGAVQGSGDLVVFTDDDAVPEVDWIATLVDAYERNDAIAVGGRVEPLWISGKAEYIPEEFYFLIGVTYKGFADEEREVRNTFGANLGFDREMFLRLGGLKQGGIDSSQIQGRETEFCARMRRIYGNGVIYTPDAIVRHKIYDYRTELGWLLRRAFWQGYSKRAMAKLVPDSAGQESKQLRRLLFAYVPGRVKQLVTHPSGTKVKQLLTLFLLLFVTGLGFLYALLWWR